VRHLPSHIRRLPNAVGSVETDLRLGGKAEEEAREMGTLERRPQVSSSSSVGPRKRFFLARTAWRASIRWEAGQADSLPLRTSWERKIKPPKFAQAQTDEVILGSNGMVPNGLGTAGAIQTLAPPGEKCPCGTVGGILVVAAR
jgi:hypothetical protein